METIKKVFDFFVGRTAQGTNFTKGDYIPVERVFNAKTSSGRNIVLDPNLIRQGTNRQRITQKAMDSLIGQAASKYEQK